MWTWTQRFDKRLARGLCALGCAAMAGPAWADAAYPSHPVRLLTAQTAGGPSDAALRGIAEILGKAMGQPFVVENRPGAEGMIAGEACARAVPDGYTLCMADSFATLLNPLIRTRISYDTVRDFSPIIHVGFLPSGIFVNSAVTARSVPELFELARNKPGTVNMASWGRASSPYIYVELLKAKGVRFGDIPYKSATAAWQAVVADEVHLTSYAVRSGLRQGDRVRLLAVNTESRMEEVPDTPTFAEVGLPSVITWFGLFSPAGTPPDIVTRLNAAIVKGLYQSPEMRSKYLGAQGLYVYGPAGGSPEALAQYIKEQSQMYTDLVTTANIARE